MSLNRFLAIGRLGTDPELKKDKSGNSICKFPLAVGETWKDKDGNKHEKTEWFRVVVFGAAADHCKQYLAKGRQVFIEGKIQNYKFVDQKDGIEKYAYSVLAHMVQFISAPDPNNQQKNSPPMREGHYEGGGVDFAKHTQAGQAQQQQQRQQPPAQAQNQQYDPNRVPENWNSDDIPF